jgi:type VI secretion system secreted protein Hcp
MADGDMFLKVTGDRAGVIKGEASDPKHTDEIQILSWSWGMSAKTEMGSGGRAGKSTMRDITFTKRVDSASTALMAAMRNNEGVKAVLTVRKAGGSPLPYFTITLGGGRIVGYEVASGLGKDPAELHETLDMSFKTISVEYTPQGKDGLRRGAMLFETETN